MNDRHATGAEHPALNELDDHGLDLLFRAARTRHFFADQPVDPALIRRVYDLASLGPTSANSSPARFVWVTSEEGKADLAEAADQGNKRKVLAAPVCVIVGKDTDFARHMPYLFPPSPAMQRKLAEPEFGAEHARRNTTLQGAWLIMAARALGLSCGPMSGFDYARIDARFFAGTAIETDFVIAMGYQGDKPDHPRNPRLAFDQANSFA